MSPMSTPSEHYIMSFAARCMGGLVPSDDELN